jgi:hypothetical protein
MSRFDEAFNPTPIDDPQEHVRSAVHINGGDLKSELEKLPADIAHYGFEYARAQRRYLAAKMTCDEVSAGRYMQVRDDLALTEKKVTEAMVDAALAGDKRVQEAKAGVIEAEFEREQMRAVCDALRAKRENLTSLALLARAELAGSHGFRDPRSDS